MDMIEPAFLAFSRTLAAAERLTEAKPYGLIFMDADGSVNLTLARARNVYLSRDLILSGDRRSSKRLRHFHPHRGDGRWAHAHVCAVPGGRGVVRLSLGHGTHGGRAHGTVCDSHEGGRRSQESGIRSQEEQNPEPYSLTAFQPHSLPLPQRSLLSALRVPSLRPLRFLPLSSLHFSAASCPTS